MPQNQKCQFKSKLYEGYSCPEPVLASSDYCIFHKPSKTEEEAKSFRKVINQKLQAKDYNFATYCFPKGVNFVNQVFEKVASLQESTFEGDVNFDGSIFKEDVWFLESTLERRGTFKNSTFEKDSIFVGSTFEGNIDFRDSTFKGTAAFGASTFKGDTGFWGSTFERFTDFEIAIFEGKVSFLESTFLSYVKFSSTTFNGNIDFTGSVFERIANFKDTIVRDNASAEEVFRIAKNCYQKQGNYTLAGEYYYKERIARRKQLPPYSPRRWFEYLLLDGLCGYGERPLRAIRIGLGVLFGLAFLYWRIGHIYASPELFNEPHTLTFWDALYFSVVTFTTLGFGDWRPDPSHWIRYVVMSEAFIGAFLMALFIVTFARRMMR